MEYARCVTFLACVARQHQCYTQDRYDIQHNLYCLCYGAHNCCSLFCDHQTQYAVCCWQAVAALGLFAVLARRYNISFRGKQALTSAAKFLGPTGEHHLHFL